MWEEFVEPEFEMPQIVVERLIEGFSKATRGLAQLYVMELVGTAKKNSRIERDFEYVLVLSSQYLGNYTFEVFKFGFNVVGYPVKSMLDSDINREIDPSDYWRTSDSQENFECLVNEIFQTEKFKNTVGGVMKLARLKLKTGDDDTPF